MNTSEDLETAKKNMDHAFVAYSQDKCNDDEIRIRQIDDLKKATIEFLELRDASKTHGRTRW